MPKPHRLIDLQQPGSCCSGKRGVDPHVSRSCNVTTAVPGALILAEVDFRDTTVPLKGAVSRFWSSTACSLATLGLGGRRGCTFARVERGASGSDAALLQFDVRAPAPVWMPASPAPSSASRSARSTASSSCSRTAPVRNLLVGRKRGSP